MLHETARHETLHDTPWDAARAQAALAAIVRDAAQNRDAGGGWPVHPLDDEGDVPPGGFKTLYFGHAGVFWALWYLERQGAIER